MIKIEAAGRSERRDRVRLKGNGETESFERTELATNRQKNKNPPRPLASGSVDP